MHFAIWHSRTREQQIAIPASIGLPIQLLKMVATTQVQHIFAEACSVHCQCACSLQHVQVMLRGATSLDLHELPGIAYLQNSLCC